MAPGLAEGAERLHACNRKKSADSGWDGKARMLLTRMEKALQPLTRTEESRRLKAETKGARWPQADTKEDQRLQTAVYDAVPGGQLRLLDPEA